MLNLLMIIGLIVSALVVGAVIYLTEKLTVSFLKKYKQKKDTVLLAMYVKDMVKNAKKMSLDDLDDDDVILAEYDEENNKLVQDISVSKNTEEKVIHLLDDNEGIVVFN